MSKFFSEEVVYIGAYGGHRFSNVMLYRLPAFSIIWLPSHA